MAFRTNNFLFRLSNKEKMLFAKSLQVMSGAGMPILETLNIIKKQGSSKTFKSIIDQLIDDVKNGRPLYTGLERYKRIFGEFFINIVKVGESSGTLSVNLEYLAEELEKKDLLNKKVKGAMIYPIIILFSTLGITGILTFLIFPKILPVLKSINVELPLPTRIFVSLSDFVSKNGLYMAVGLVIFCIIVAVLFRLKAVKYVWHGAILKIPVIKKMSKNINIINFSRNLGILLKSGVKIVEALNITAKTMPNLVYQKEVNKIASDVSEGAPLSKFLIKDSNFFPDIFAELVLAGENTGKLDESVLYLADYYDSELDQTTKTLSNVLEPALLLLMGFIVGFVALAIITPIYKVTQTLGR